MQDTTLWELTMDEIGPVETLEQGLTLFETVAMPARNWAERTRQEYASDIADLIAFLAERGVTNLTQVGLEDLEHYQAEMDRRGYKASTRKRKTYAIKSFIRFLHQRGLLDTNIASGLIPPQPKKREPRYLTEDEYQRLLRACSHKPRDAAIIELFLQTGMRLSELARLTLDDIELPRRITKDPENVGLVHVRRKGGKEGTIPLNWKACQALHTWLKVRPPVDHDSLFVSKFKKPLSKRAIQHMIKKYLKEAGIKNASVHTLRHTHGTHHALKGTDIRTIQETMGHENLETTTIYIALAKKAQRKALQEHAL